MEQPGMNDIGLESLDDLAQACHTGREFGGAVYVNAVDVNVRAPQALRHRTVTVEQTHDANAMAETKKPGSNVPQGIFRSAFAELCYDKKYFHCSVAELREQVICLRRNLLPRTVRFYILSRLLSHRRQFVHRRQQTADGIDKRVVVAGSKQSAAAG